MRVFYINGDAAGSTGNIIKGVIKLSKEHGIESVCAIPVTNSNLKKRPDFPHITIGTYRTRQINVLLARITGYNGCFAPFSTLKLLRKISKFKPDLLHMHNLHDSYINLPMLFKYIKKHNIKTIWTLHDCWAFTGHCSHFAMAKCDKWKTGCYNCACYKKYPTSYTDNSKKMFAIKKRLFTGVKQLKITTPSHWLADRTRESFLKEYPIQVINNGINLDVFKPVYGDFRKKYGIEDKKIILGVAFAWGQRIKGLDVFIELSKRLPDDFKIVLVGIEDSVAETLPQEIIAIKRTQNQTELAEIYTAADVFVNPTREETFGLVIVEALACGTPVITFRAGGSPEILDEKSGVVVDLDDIDSMEKEILHICKEQPFSKENCFNRAKVFDMNAKYMDYINLYKSEEQCE